MGKKDTGQEGSGVPIPALYKVTLLLSVLLVCTYISFEKKNVLQIKKWLWNHESIARLLPVPPPHLLYRTDNIIEAWRHNVTFSRLHC